MTFDLFCDDDFRGLVVQHLPITIIWLDDYQTFSVSRGSFIRRLCVVPTRMSKEVQAIGKKNETESEARHKKNNHHHIIIITVL